MPVKILMPALSPTMTEGNLVRWLKAEGDIVKSGQVLAEIETDKATMEVEAVEEGTLAKIIVAAGSEGVKVNSLIAVLLEEGEDAASIDAFISTADPAVSVPSTVSASAPKSANISNAAAITNSPADERLFVSPLAKRIAQQNQINLATITGSGPRGRIVKADVEQAALTPSSQSVSTAVQTIVYGDSGYADLPLNNMRKVIARRLTESKQQVPHFYLNVDCELDALLALRSDVNARLDEGKLSVNDFIVRACALALIKVPEANVSWMDTHIRQFQAADISVAVAIDGGLVTPVVRSANLKSMKDISAEVKVLADKARAGKLAPEDYQGGSFTISNLGMYGIKQFSAIINPPQACILAVGAGEKRPVVKEGALTVATVMSCTLSADHRAVDGAVGARFLEAFKAFIEDPLRLLV